MAAVQQTEVVQQLEVFAEQQQLCGAAGSEGLDLHSVTAALQQAICMNYAGRLSKWQLHQSSVQVVRGTLRDSKPTIKHGYRTVEIIVSCLKVKGCLVVRAVGERDKLR